MPDKVTDSGFVERISGEYYNLTAAEKRVADFILSHRTQCQHMSITELAEASGVAEATLSRFARQLKYKSFNEFRMDMAKTAITYPTEMGLLSGEVKPGDSFSEVIRKLYAADVDAITQTLELIDESKIRQAADILEKADKVFCMGQGGSQILAEEAAHLFTTVECKYFAVADSHTQVIAAANMTGKDAILYFSYSGATKDMIHTLNVAGGNGVKIVLITRFPNAPGARLADVVLQCGSNESPLQLGSVPARIAQMYLLDVLFSELCLRNMEKPRTSRRNIALALKEKHL